MKLLARPYTGVTAFVGMPGSGKTYSLVEVARRELDNGRRVFTNAGFDVTGCEQYTSFEDMWKLPNDVTILLDEAPLYFNSRRWQEFPDGVFYRLQQIRKDGLKFYYSAMHEGRIDVSLRQITFHFWHCRSITKTWMRRSLWGPEEFRKAKARPVRSEWFRVRPEVAAMYDTYGKVAVAIMPEGDETARQSRRRARQQREWVKPLEALTGSEGSETSS